MKEGFIKGGICSLWYRLGNTCRGTGEDEPVDHELAQAQCVQ